MANYYVLTPPGSTDPERDTLFIRDGFSWLAFVFPLPWLLVRRLWLIAGLSVILYLVAVLAAESWGLDGLPLAFSVVFSLWTGFEGGHVRALWLARKGWEMKTEIAAHDLDEAEAIYFEGMDDASASTRASGLFRGTGARATNAVALGLIGPYGGR
jgi:hypothetical protein